MDLKTHQTMQSLNERVIVLIWEINELSNYPELRENIEHLVRVSKNLHIKSLKTFNDENNKI